MESFSFCWLSVVEKLRDASNAAGGEGHRRGYRDTRDAVHWAGRKRVEALDMGSRVLVCEARRRAARHGRFELCGMDNRQVRPRKAAARLITDKE